MSYVVDVYDWTNKTRNKLLSIDFIRFGIVGSSGFIINYILLTILFKYLKIEIIVAQIIAGEIALLNNFIFHSYWTYTGHKHIPLFKKLIKFHITCLSAQVIILAIETFGVKTFKINYGVALIIASGVAMIWNYLWTKYYVFKKNK